MFKLAPQSEKKNLPDARKCLKWSHKARIFLLGGTPTLAIFFSTLPFDPNEWIMGISLAVGLSWMMFVFIQTTDRARDEYIKNEKRHPCRNCGYSLTGLTIPQCPECGVVLSNFDPDDYRALS